MSPDGVGTAAGVAADTSAGLRDLIRDGPLFMAPVPAALTADLGNLLHRIADRDLIDVAVDKAGRRERRERALPAWVVVYVVFALCLFSSEGASSVLRNIWPRLNGSRARPVPVPDDSALVKARKRLGPAPLQTLFDQVRGPLAAADTPGAFAFGLRLVSIDGTVLDVPDSADNDAAFARTAGSRGSARNPQVRLTLLIECATHAVLAAQFDGTQTSEHVMADAIITNPQPRTPLATPPGLEPGMLLLADRNFHSYQRFRDTAATGAHLLWRIRYGKAVQGTPTLPVLHPLPDGSYLSRLTESNPARRQRSNRTGNGKPLRPRHPDTPVRVIDYTITVTTTDGATHHEHVRLLTTILDPAQATATELAACYHERWESETSYGHLKTRLRGPRTVLRSRHPDTIHQEIWAYLCIYQALCNLAATAAATAGLDPDRISFTITLREFRRTLTNPHDHPPHQLINTILDQTNPTRRDRVSDRTSKPQHGRQPRTHKATFHITTNPHQPHQNP